MYDPAPDEDRYFTKREAADYLRLCTRTIENMVARGQIPTYRIGVKLLFRKSELDTFVTERLLK